jgi:hypothetical protein
MLRRESIALPAWLSCLEHRSKPGLKSYLVKSYKLSLIINLHMGRSFLFRMLFKKKSLLKKFS